MKTKTILFTLLTLISTLFLTTFAQAHNYNIQAEDAIEVIQTQPTVQASYYWFVQARGKTGYFVEGDEPRIRIILTSDSEQTDCTNRLTKNLKTIFLSDNPSPKEFTLVSGNTNIDLIGHTGIPLCQANWTLQLSIFNKHNGERILSTREFSTIPKPIEEHEEENKGEEYIPQDNTDEELNTEQKIPEANTDVETQRPNKEKVTIVKKASIKQIKASKRKISVKLTGIKNKKITIQILKNKKKLKSFKRTVKNSSNLSFKHSLKKGTYKLVIKTHQMKTSKTFKVQ